MSESDAPKRLVNGVEVLLTEDEIAAIAAEEAAIAARPPPRWEVPQLVVVDRLVSAGKLRAALAALQMDASADALSDAELVLRERWRAASALYSDDADAIAFFTAIGADAAAILARP